MITSDVKGWNLVLSKEGKEYYPFIVLAFVAYSFLYYFIVRDHCRRSITEKPSSFSEKIIGGDVDDDIIV